MMSLPGPPARAGIFDNPGWGLPRQGSVISHPKLCDQAFKEEALQYDRQYTINTI